MIPPGDSNGTVWIFDPTFCGIGPNASGGYYGTGDHWIGGTIGAPVSTYFTLYDENDTPYEWSDDTLVASSGTLFENEKGTDQSKSGGTYIWGTPQKITTDGVPDCSASLYHNKWWQLATGLLPGTYRLQISTTNQGNSAINSGTNAENMWSIEARPARRRPGPRRRPDGRLQQPRVGPPDLLHGPDRRGPRGQDPRDRPVRPGRRQRRRVHPDPDPQRQRLQLRHVQLHHRQPVHQQLLAATTCPRSRPTGARRNPFNNTWITILIPLPSTYGSRA